MFKDRQKPSSKDDDNPKIYKIGLYKSEGTQYDTVLKPSTFKEANENPDDYEKISFSLTISTDTSDTETEDTHVRQPSYQSHASTRQSYIPNIEEQATLKQIKTKINDKIPQQSRDVDIYAKLSKTATDDEVAVPEFVSVLISRSPATLQKVIPMIRKSVKLRSSLFGTNTDSEDVNVSKKAVRHEDVISPAKEFSEQILSIHAHEIVSKPGTSSSKQVKSHTKPEGKKRVSKPKTAEKNTILTKDALRKKEEDNIKPDSNIISKSSTSNTEKDLKDPNNDSSKENKYSNDFSVMAVHVHGDSLLLSNPADYINALEVTQNGRYKDEATLFCQNDYPEYSPYYSNREYTKMSLNYKEMILDSSNSDTIASKTLSDGEVKCHCSVSSGELHRCKGNNVLEARQNTVLSRTKKKKYPYKKRSYFNNLVTYYIKNDHTVNDSSWPNSKK